MMPIKTFVSERRAANLLQQIRWRDGVVDERFGSISDRRVQTDSDAEVDEATQKRLEDLGYM